MTLKFSLQSVLDYRQNRVEILEIELGHLLQEQKRFQTFLEALQNSHGRLLEKLGHKQMGEIDLVVISQLRSNIKSVKSQITQQRTRLIELAEQILEKRRDVVYAKQEAETLVILKRKEDERYQEEQAREENRLQDDIYIARAFHRSTTAA